jgi:hypothetical protein
MCGGVGEASSACVFAVWSDGEGDREAIPEESDERPGALIERRTVSSVFSIFRNERVNCSCLRKLLRGGNLAHSYLAELNYLLR